MPEQLSLIDLPVERPKHSVLFFAIVPDEDAKQGIGRIARSLRAEHGLTGRLIAPDRLHVTLLTIHSGGTVPDEIIAAVCTAARQLAAAPFDVAFDRVMSFPNARDNRPFVLLNAENSTSLLTFQTELHHTLASAGVVAPTKKQFTPHVTLAYDHREVRENPVAPVMWTVRDFALIESVQGETRHIHHGRWPLSG